ncbi:MAG: flippase [Nostoc sp.]|uniref:flippase n=1 Tax=Nostoc sp. TaxID=1180 RepID=UPI002FFC8A72
MLGKYNIQKLLPFKKNLGSELRAIIANTGWLFADQIFRMVVGIVVSVWIARYLGAQQYGLFNYVAAFVALFSPFANLGLDSVAVRHIVRDSWSKEQILGTAFWLKFFGGVGSVFLATASIYWLRQDEKLTVWLVVILATAGIFQAFDTINFWFQSQVQSKYTVLARNIAFILITLLKVTLIVMQAPLIAFAWVNLAEIALAALSLIIVYRIKGYSLWFWSWSFPIAKLLFKESWPLMFSGLAVVIYMKIDQIMLGEMLGNGSVAIYSVAARISEVWYFIPMAIASSVTPAIFTAKETSEALYYRRIEQLLRLLVLLSVVIAIPMTFMSGTIVTTLFGKEYANAGQVLAIHIWASLFVFMGVGTASWFVAEGLTHLSMYRNLIGAITNVLLNLFLIPSYAEVGAAIATVFSYAFSGFLIHAIHSKTQKLFWLQIKSFAFFRD